jgi:hypothetical protein
MTIRICRKLRDGALASSPAGQACVPPPTRQTQHFAKHPGGEDARRASRRDASVPVASAAADTLTNLDLPRRGAQPVLVIDDVEELLRELDDLWKHSGDSRGRS